LSLGFPFAQVKRRSEALPPVNLAFSGPSDTFEKFHAGHSSKGNASLMVGFSHVRGLEELPPSSDDNNQQADRNAKENQ
jgi:hypothetical protein